jgi:hypothetical protein
LVQERGLHQKSTLLMQSRFHHATVTPCWSQADYFKPVVPLYLVVVAFDAALRRPRLS